MLITPEVTATTQHARVERAADGRWHVRGYPEAREIMRLTVTQAGFNAEQVLKMPGGLVRPVLFVDGLAIERAPTYAFNERFAGYELSGFEISCAGSRQ